MSPRRIRVPQALGEVARVLQAGFGAQDAPHRVLVAWSGGPDSAALLGLCELLVHRLGLELALGHVDHGLRPASVAEAELVRHSARARGHRVMIQRLALTPGPGVAARARDARRAALQAQAKAWGTGHVLLGHTATDQAETMVLHLCRGAGLEGIAAMAEVEPWSAPGAGTWVRPLLHLTRDQTRGLALELGIPFVDDPTNDDENHGRVLVRQQVIPALLRLNPRAIEHFGAAASRAREVQAILQKTVPSSQGGVLDARALRQVPEALRMAALHDLCIASGLARDAVPQRTLVGVDRALARGLGRRRWCLAQGRVLHLAAGRLWIEALGSDVRDPAPTLAPNH